MERHYEGSNILFLESGTQSKSSQTFFAFFIIYGGSNIWLDLENTGRVTAGKLLATADVQKTSFLQMCR